MDVVLPDRSAQRLRAGVASSGFFECLGVRPAVGRLFRREDTNAGPDVVLSHRLWQRAFDRAPDAVGRVIHLNRQPFVVVGVTPPDFEGIGLEALPDVWLPMSQLPAAMPGVWDQARHRSSGFFNSVGRLAPGISSRAARSELDAIAVRLGAGQPARDGPESEDPDWREPWPWIEPAAAVAGRRAQASARLLAGIAALVLALASADVAGLMLARAEGRHRELALRMALGASPWRVVRPLVFEALLLSCGGALAGLFVAHVATRIFLAAAPADVGIPWAAVSGVTAPRTLAATAGLALLATLLAGIWPALGAVRVEPLAALRDDRTSGVARWLSARGALVALQVGVATVLLIGAGALLRTLWTVGHIEPGIDPDGILVAELDLARGGYDKARGAAFATRLEELLQTTPGVSAGALSIGAPLAGGPMTTVTIDGHPTSTDFVMVTPGYFATLGIRVIQGRGLERADGPQATPIAVVNRTFARRFWPGANPVGRHIAGFTPRGTLLVVAGVVADVRTHGLREPARPLMYVPMAQFYEAFPWQFSLTAMIRTPVAAGSANGMLDGAVHTLDSTLPVLHPSTLATALGEPFGQQRLLAGLLGAFAFLALLLAATGLYGVVSLATAARTREFGVRIAVGALPRDLHRLVHGRSLVLCSLGLLGGLGTALAARRALDPFLFGVSSIDPLAFAAAPIVLLLVAMLAAEGPARRAFAVDTMQALRRE